MDLALKYKIVEKIVHSEDDMILNEIKALLGLSEKDFWPELPEGAKQAIEDAKIELDNGNGIPHDQVIKEMNDHFFK